MGLIKEPLNVDFYVTGKQMTEEDQKRVSEFIKVQSVRKRTLSSKRKNADKENASPALPF